ncbi:MAG TPA: hypothetical protein PLO67_08950 [Saprospiraceae bacterium]|nr:hypothetical protein [Saprospiraceae bacterium]HPI07611.1 hypothetical protein [Saprospiraceae bacterium]
MYQIRLLAALLITLSMFISCKKSDEEKSRVLGAWLLEERWLDFNSDGVLEATYPLHCAEDTYHFSGNGELRLEERITGCEPAIVPDIYGSWESLRDDREISIQYDNFETIYYYSITSVTNSRLELDRIFPDGPNAQVPAEKLVLRR